MTPKGHLKRAKKKGDKKKSPLHPSYKEESGVVEKEEKTLPLYREALRFFKEILQLFFW